MTISREHRYVAAYVLLTLLALVLIRVSGSGRLVEAEQVVPDLIAVEAGDFYTNTFRIHQVSPKLRVHMEVEGRVSVKIGDLTKACGPGSCERVFNLLGARESVPFEIFADEGAKVRNFEYRVVKYKSETTLSQVTSSAWFYVGVLFLLTVAINYFFYERKTLNQWLLIGIAFSLLGVNDWLFTLALAGFLAAMWGLRHWVSGDARARRLWALVLVAVLFLLLWKYGKETLYASLQGTPGLSLFMPVGVSYFVIRLIDTLLRWYRKESVELQFREFLLFIIFPGTLVAGPIENVKDFFGNRCARLDRDDLGYGVGRVCIGLAKKFVIADGFLYPGIHGEYGGAGVDALILGQGYGGGLDIMAFAVFGLLYAYVDFSAYSDIAIGASRLFGYRICENFNFPILASNIREYWKRWHMSLSNWAFRNVYFPVLLQTRNSYLPLYMTMLLIGLWHAFSFSWFAWALHHATGMSVVGHFQKWFPKVSRSKNPLLHWGAVGATVVYASMGFVFVYLDDFSVALRLYLGYWQLFVPFWS
jgi:alginate O-acetyltransferase complex protein AlgI